MMKTSPPAQVKHLRYKVAATFSRQQQQQHHHHQQHTLQRHHHILSSTSASASASSTECLYTSIPTTSQARSYHYHHQHHQFRERELQVQTLPFQRGQFITPSPVNMPLSKESAEAIARLRAYRPPPSSWGALDVTRRAAVLILLYADVSGSLRVVLTERSNSLRSFAGEVALPGGKADTLSETPFDTARREAEEEIGLPVLSSKLPKHFTISHLCEMPTNLSRNNLAVRPCVAFLSSTSDTTTDSLIPRLDPGEVQSVFTAPLEPFLRHDYTPPDLGPHSFDEQTSPWYSGYWVNWYTSRYKLHEFQVPARPILVKRSRSTGSGSGSPGATGSNTTAVWHDEKIVRYRVWGMTARILVDAARVAYGKDPTFEFSDGFGDDEMIEELRVKGMLPERKKGVKEENAREGLMKKKAQEKKL